MGPSASCHSWTQQATIFDWQVNDVDDSRRSVRARHKKEAKDRQIILSELPKLQSCDESTDVPTDDIYSVLNGFYR